MLLLRNHHHRFLVTIKPTTTDPIRALNSQLKKSSSLLQVESIILQTPKQHFDIINCSVALALLGKQASRNELAISKILNAADVAAAAMDREISPKLISNLVFSIAAGKLRPCIPEFLTMRAVGMNIKMCDDYELSNLVWSFAKLHQTNHDLFHRVTNHYACAGMMRCSPQQLTNIIWAISPTCPQVLDCAAQAIPTMQKFNVKDITTLLLCFAKHGSAGHKSVFDHFTPMIAQQVLSTQHVASLTWSFASVGLRIPLGLRNEICSQPTKPFTPQQVADICWAFACEKDDFNWFPVAEALVKGQAKELTLKPALTLLRAFASKNYKSDSLCQSLVATDAARFSPQDVVHMLHGFAKCGFQCNAEFLQNLKNISVKNLSTAQLANFIWAGAKLGVDFTDAALPELSARRDLNARDISNAMWACAILQRAEACSKFASHVPHATTITTHQELSTTLWAFATLGHASREFWAKQAAYVKQCKDLHTFSPQSLSMLMWSFATARHVGDKALCDMVVNEIQRRDEAFSFLDITKLLWAFGELGEPVPLLADRFAKELACLQINRVEDVSRVLWAFAKLGFRCPILCDRMSRQVNVNASNTDGLVSMMNAFALLDYRRDSLCHAVADELLVQRTLNVEQLTELLFAFAQVRYLPVQQQYIDFNPQSIAQAHTLSRLVYSIANLRLSNDGVDLNAVANAVCANVAVFSQRDLTMLVWSFAAMDALGLPCVQQFFHSNSAVITSDNADLAPMLALVQLSWQHTHPNDPNPALLASLYPQQQHKPHVNEPSLTHRTIARLLQDYAYADLENEAPVCNGKVIVDIFIPSRNIVIEVDGPHHFFHDQHTRTGKTELKHRVLRQQGYSLYSINAIEFQKLDTETKQIDWLRSKLLF